MKPAQDAGPAPRLRSRSVDEINGLKVHILEAGFDAPGRQLVLMLHGFPEIAYSWRKVMPALAAAGYHVVAPDLRGYGRMVVAQQGHHVFRVRTFSEPCEPT